MKEETVVATANQLLSREPQAAEKASLRWLLALKQSKEAITSDTGV